LTVAPCHADADLIVLDTLGKLFAHGHGLNGYCRRDGLYLLHATPLYLASPLVAGMNVLADYVVVVALTTAWPSLSGA
jgi:hypothetical protein